MRGSVSSPMTLMSPTSMPKPCRKPWLRWTPTTGSPSAPTMSIRPILASAAASPSLALAHWPMSRPAWKLSVAKVTSTASGRIGLGVERDDHQAGFTCRLDGRRHAGVGRSDEDGGGTTRDRVLDARGLAFGVRVHLAPAGVQVGTELRSTGFGALDHPDPERVDVLLDDELDIDAGAVELGGLVAGPTIGGTTAALRARLRSALRSRRSRSAA